EESVDHEQRRHGEAEDHDVPAKEVFQPLRGVGALRRIGGSERHDSGAGGLQRLGRLAARHLGASNSSDSPSSVTPAILRTRASRSKGFSFSSSASAARSGAQANFKPPFPFALPLGRTPSSAAACHSRAASA